MGRQAKDAMMTLPATFLMTAATGTLVSLLPVPAMAHWGHFGELGGHGHLIAVGLGAVAVAGMAGLAIWAQREDRVDEEMADAADAEDALIDEGEQAHA
jgi:hypothetical protein